MPEIARRTTAGSLEYLADYIQREHDAETPDGPDFDMLRAVLTELVEARRPSTKPDPDNFIVHMDGIGLMVECTHPDCRRNGSGHYTRFGRRITVTEVHEAMDAHDRLEGNHDGEDRT